MDLRDQTEPNCNNITKTALKPATGCHSAETLEKPVALKRVVPGPGDM